MSKSVVTVVDAKVKPERESELIDGYRQMVEGRLPEGILRSELLRGAKGAWRIQSTWKDMEALEAVRTMGSAPPALALFDRIATNYTHTWFVIEARFPAD